MLCSLHQVLSEEVYCKRQQSSQQQDVKVVYHIYRQMSTDFLFMPLILATIQAVMK